MACRVYSRAATFFLASTLWAQDASRLSRWVSIDQAVIGTRIVSVEGGDSSTVNQLQYQGLFAGAFNFDSGRRVRLHVGGGTGPYFSGAWNDTGLGTAPGLARLYLRDLYFSVEPIRGVELDYGSLKVEPYGSGIAGLAGVGYIVGERAVVKRPELFFDRIAFTYGYLGDLERPDVHDRLRRLANVNYSALTVDKKVHKNVTVAAQYSHTAGAPAFSADAQLQLPAGFSTRLEFYRRFRILPHGGFNTSAGRTMGRFRLDGGFTSVDRFFGPLNADNFREGRRFYISGAVKITQGVAASFIYNKAVANAYQPTIDSFFATAIHYDLRNLIDRH